MVTALLSYKQELVKLQIEAYIVSLRAWPPSYPISTPSQQLLGNFMKNKSHHREVDRDTVPDNVDFVSAGPWELFVLLSLTLLYCVTFLALSKLSAQLYGSTAAQLCRPIVPILITGAVCALAPSHKTSSPTRLLCCTSVFWAVFLKYLPQILKHDVELLGPGLSHVGSLWEHIQAKGVTLAAEHWIPIIASSILESIFYAPLTVVLVGMLRQRARKTHLPPVMIMGMLISFALLVVAILQYYGTISGSDIFRVVPLLAMMSLLTSRSYASMVSSLLCCIVVIWTLKTTTTLDCWKLPRILSCLKAVGGFEILASAESQTGRITVVENLKYRLMKADHSLLGGEWLGDGIGQSIFTAFYMQALAIYAFLPRRTNLDVLQIGLGIGTATKTLLDSPQFVEPGTSLSLQVVELDTKVIEYAHKYFGLPKAEQDSRLRIHNQNALEFVGNAANGTFDLISHDVFSGGSLAYPLFTVQFFRDLQHKLKPGGILTVNFVYAPKLAHLNFEAVTNTLQSVFSEVEVFVESGRLTTVNNLVFFCSNSAMKLDIPDSGRKPRSTFGQTARNMKSWRFTGVSDIPQNETLVLQNESIDSGASRANIASGEMQMALEHWNLMRALLPSPEDEIWTSF